MSVSCGRDHSNLHRESDPPCCISVVLWFFLSNVAWNRLGGWSVQRINQNGDWFESTAGETITLTVEAIKTSFQVTFSDLGSGQLRQQRRPV
jgi:hypothetical protein